MGLGIWNVVRHPSETEAYGMAVYIGHSVTVLR